MATICRYGGKKSWTRFDPKPPPKNFLGPGLRDHYWTALKLAAAVGWALVTAWAYTAAGLPGALIAAVGGALVLFVLSRML
ncbi:MAG: hypothetical protein ACE10D_08115 [Planctomycetota bacterium]